MQFSFLTRENYLWPILQISMFSFFEITKQYYDLIHIYTLAPELSLYLFVLAYHQLHDAYHQLHDIQFRHSF